MDMEESEPFVPCPYCRTELPRELIRTHVEEKHIISLVKGKDAEEKAEVKAGGGTSAPPRSSYNTTSSNDQANQRKAEDKPKEKTKKGEDALWGESLNFCSWSDSEDDPDPVEKPDEKSKEESAKQKKVEPVPAKAQPTKVAEMRQAQTRPAAPEKKDQMQVKIQNETKKRVMERLNELELERKKRAQAQSQLNRNQPQGSGNNQSHTRLNQSQPKREEAQPLEPQVALCGLCNFANPFSTTQALIAHVRKAHERSAGNLPTIRHRVAPAKNFPVMNVQGEESQPVVDEEVARDETCCCKHILRL